MSLDPRNIKPGQEQYEEFFSKTLKKNMIHYDYRDMHGTLFTCITNTLEEARWLRDEWMESKGGI